MKKISIPQNVELVDLSGNPVRDNSGAQVTVSFRDFVVNTLLTDPKFGKGMAEILSAVEIKGKVSAATTELELDNSDYERLLSIANEPSNPYNPAVVVQLVPFLLAIKNAK